MGQFPRHPRRSPLFDPVLPPDLHDPQAPVRGQFEYTDDVHPNARELGVCGESGGATGIRGVEHLGCVCCDGIPAGDAAFPGYIL